MWFKERCTSNPNPWEHYEAKAQNPSCLRSSVRFSQSVIIWGVRPAARVSPKTDQPSVVKCKRTSFIKIKIFLSQKPWNQPTLPKVPVSGVVVMTSLHLIGHQTGYSKKRRPLIATSVFYNNQPTASSAWNKIPTTHFVRMIYFSISQHFCVDNYFLSCSCVFSFFWKDFFLFTQLSSYMLGYSTMQKVIFKIYLCGVWVTGCWAAVFPGIVLAIKWPEFCITNNFYCCFVKSWKTEFWDFINKRKK